MYCPTDNIELELKNRGYKYIIGVDEVGRGCENPDAEILTNNGWKYYTDIDVLTDMVLSYTPEGYIEWQSIESIYEKDFVGDLVDLSNRSVHISVTPDHYFDVLRRTFVRDRLDNNKLKMTGYIFNNRKSVEDLVDNDYIPRGGKWIGKNTDMFILSYINKLKNDYSEKDFLDKQIPMDIWVSFIGIYLAEGSYVYDESLYRYATVVSQSKTASPKNFAKIKDLLDMLPFTFNSYGSGFVCYDKQLSFYMSQFGNKYTKFIPAYLKNLSGKYLNLLIDWMIIGDGTAYTGKNKQESRVYYTASTKLKDDFEEILLKAGWTYKTAFREPRDAYIKDRLLKKENQVGCFETRLRRNNKISCKHLYKKYVPYSGKVFCLSLSKYHNFYVRRSGSGYFTGNSLMGPVVAAAVCIPEGFYTTGINDSKKLSSKQRELIYNKIIEGCVYSVSFVDEKIIDTINIREATKLAMRNCINDIHAADYALVDGNFIPELIHIPAQPVVGGDALSLSIAAASIVAKVTRDGWVKAAAEKFPVYGWEKNKGYGTKDHMASIRLYGPCVFHRKSFGGVKEHIWKN